MIAKLFPLKSLFRVSVGIQILTIGFLLFSTTRALSLPLLSRALFQPKELTSTCQQYLETLKKDGFTFDWLIVPETSEETQNRDLQIFYYYRAPLNAKTAVLFFNGGPAADSHLSYQLFDDKIRDLGIGKQISLIYMDQRGTGCSSPYPEGNDPEILRRLKNYGSRSIVQDAEALRSKLFGPATPWKIYGQSYGAHIVHRYVSLYPESIRGAYAHANTLNSDPIARLAARIYSQHRVLELYLKKYPKDRGAFAMLDQILSDPSYCIEYNGNQNICGFSISEAIIPILTFSQKWAQLHDLINSMIRFQPQPGIFSPSRKDIVAFVKKYIPPSNESVSWALAVLNEYDRNLVPQDLEFCTQAYQYIEKQFNIKPQEMHINECQAALQFQLASNKRPFVLEALAGQKDFLTLTSFKHVLLKMNLGALFLYSGERDCLVPKESFVEEVEFLGDAIRYTHFPNSGHEGFVTEPQIWIDLIQGN